MTDKVLKTALNLRGQGFAIHWLHPNSKRPIGNDWTNTPVLSQSDLRRSYRDGYNVGVRLGKPSKILGQYLHAIDLDIRDEFDADEAHDALGALFPGYERLPTVKSGSGGESRHYYFVTDKPFPAKKLARSRYKSKGADGKSHWNWEVELIGTGKQIVLPPSIHPDTGRAYKWIREFDVDDLDFELPVVPSRIVEQWIGGPVNSADGADLDLDDLMASAPLGLTIEAASDIVFALPRDEYCEDRDGWYRVGMALHHEFDGSDEAFDLWCEFSEQSDKFNMRDQKRVWRSFKDRLNPLRMATLLAVTKRLEKEAESERLALLKAADADDDFDESDDNPFDYYEREARDTGEDSDDDLLFGDMGHAEKLNSAAEDREWRKLLDLTPAGAVKPTLHNLKLILRHDARTAGVPAKNIFTGDIVQRRKPGVKASKRRGRPVMQLDDPAIWTIRDEINGDLWTDEKDASIRAMLEAPERFGGYGIKITDRDLKAAIDLVAVDNSFHPIQEYLSSLVWDGKKRLATVFDRYLGCGDNAYTRAVSRLTFVAAVTRAFEPGHKFDFVTIFEGLQGKGKSTFIERMAKHWFVELPANAFDEKKVLVETIQGAWIAEIPELSGFRKSEVNEIKAAVSARSDRVRLSYDRRARDFKRGTIFMGSTNELAYLRDETGNRRFWPLVCTVSVIDIKSFTKEVDQLWAEAVVEYRRLREKQPHGTLPLYLSSDEAALIATEQQAERKIETPEDMLSRELSNWLDSAVPASAMWSDTSASEYFADDDCEKLVRDVVSWPLICRCFLRRDPVNVTGEQMRQITKIMRHMPGWRKEPNPRRVPTGRQEWVYVRSDTTFDEARANGWGRPSVEDKFREYEKAG